MTYGGITASTVSVGAGIAAPAASAALSSDPLYLSANGSENVFIAAGSVILMHSVAHSKPVCARVCVRESD